MTVTPAMTLLSGVSLAGDAPPPAVGGSSGEATGFAALMGTLGGGGTAGSEGDAPPADADSGKRDDLAPTPVALAPIVPLALPVISPVVAPPIDDPLAPGLSALRMAAASQPTPDTVEGSTVSPPAVEISAATVTPDERAQALQASDVATDGAVARQPDRYMLLAEASVRPPLVAPSGQAPLADGLAGLLPSLQAAPALATAPVGAPLPGAMIEPFRTASETGVPVRRPTAAGIAILPGPDINADPLTKMPVRIEPDVRIGARPRASASAAGANAPASTIAAPISGRAAETSLPTDRLEAPAPGADSFAQSSTGRAAAPTSVAAEAAPRQPFAASPHDPGTMPHTVQPPSGARQAAPAVAVSAQIVAAAPAFPSAVPAPAANLGVASSEKSLPAVGRRAERSADRAPAVPAALRSAPAERTVAADPMIRRAVAERKSPRPAAIDTPAAAPIIAATPDAAAPAAVARAVDAAAVAPAADRQLDLARANAWIDGIARDIASAGAGGDARFTVSPAALGTVHVAISRDGGVADIAITAASPEAGAALSDGRHALLAAARAHGIEVRHATIDVASPAPDRPTPQPAEAPSSISLTDRGYGGGVGTGDTPGRRQHAPQAEWQADRPRSAARTAAARASAHDDGLYA